MSTPPLPLPDLEAEPLAPFWRAAQQREFKMPLCRACGRIDWYPTGVCRTCRSPDIAWRMLSGRATLFSWALVRRALDVRLAPLAPYLSAIVTLEEDHHSRFVTRLIDLKEEEFAIGMCLSVRMLDLGYPDVSAGVLAPLFTRA